MSQHKQPSKQPEGKPTHDEVAREAYALYLKAGCPEGHALEHWLKAETKLLNERSGYHHPYLGPRRPDA